MDAPAVSVIVTTMDRPRLLADALAGVAAQAFAPLEVRIADAGLRPALEAMPEPGFLEATAILVPGLPPGAARNAAARGARGEWLAFLDDDDLWRRGHLEGLAHAFRDPGVGFAWRDSVVVRERVGEDGVRVPLDSAMLAADWDEERMRSDDYLPPSAWGVRRTLFERLGGFDESFVCSEDWDFVLRAARVTRVLRVPGATVEVRMRDHGHASAEGGPGRRECLARLAERHGLAPLEPKTFWDVARAAEARR